MNALLTKSTPTVEKPATKSPFLTVSSPSHEAVPAGTGPTASPVGPRIISQDYDPIRHRDETRGWLTIPVLITRWSDGVTMLNLRIQTERGEQAVSIRHDAFGPIIQVMSGTHSGQWYVVTAQRCQCYGFATHHHCKHQEARRLAAGIVETWQFAQRKRALAAQQRDYDDAMDMQHWDEVA